MATILSLSKARKEKARSTKEQQAAENRIAFGRTKAEKATQQAEAARVKSFVEGHKRGIKDSANE